MIGRRVAGLAVIVSEMDPRLVDELAAARIPCVFYDVGVVRKNITNIRVDYRRGIERIVEYLHDLGHTRLAFVGHHAQLAPTSERERAFIDAVEKYAPAVEWRTLADRDGLEGGRQATRQLLESGFDPTAIICVNDFTALGALRELRDQGLSVPRDVSLTGFDNIRLAEYCEPALTTVDIPRDQIGRLAYAALVPEDEETRAPGRELVIEPQVVLRRSTGPAPKRSRAH
jgi:DNA-binding LacI/PurR family transcriptional regulator